MFIDFSDYKSLTHEDIVCINETGVEYANGTILFLECCRNFSQHHSIKGNYVGEFDVSGSRPYICLYTAPYTTHFFFMDDDNKYRQTIERIKQYGYELVDSEKIYRH